MDLYKNIKHSCTFADLRHLCVRDSLLCVFICSKISINSNGWLGHLIGSVNCDVTGPLWRHQKAVSCLGWDKSISDTRRSSRTPGCTRQIDLRPPMLVSYASMYETKWSHGHLIFNLGIPIPGKMVFILRWGPDFFFFFFLFFQLGNWFADTFEHLSQVPRYLIPCYFDAIVTGVYMIVEEVAWAKMPP